HEQGRAGRSVGARGAQPAHVGGRSGDPERRPSHGELGDDLVAVAHEVQDDRPERRLVEGHGVAGSLHPQLGLNARHRGSPTSMPAGASARARPGSARAASAPQTASAAATARAGRKPSVKDAGVPSPPRAPNTAVPTAMPKTPPKRRSM